MFVLITILKWKTQETQVYITIVIAGMEDGTAVPTTRGCCNNAMLVNHLAMTLTAEAVVAALQVNLGRGMAVFLCKRLTATEKLKFS